MCSLFIEHVGVVGLVSDGCEKERYPDVMLFLIKSSFLRGLPRWGVAKD